MTKLNVGCGNMAFASEGWINIDKCLMPWTAEHPEIEYMRQDVRDHLPFADNSIEEIMACHFLEHLTYEEGDDFLRECHRALRPGGKLYIIVPDFEYMVAQYLHDQGQLRVIGTALIYGTRDTNLDTGSFHQSCYDAPLLVRSATDAGFTVEIVGTQGIPYIPLVSDIHLCGILTKGEEH